MKKMESFEKWDMHVQYSKDVLWNTPLEQVKKSSRTIINDILSNSIGKKEFLNSAGKLHACFLEVIGLIKMYGGLSSEEHDMYSKVETKGSESESYKWKLFLNEVPIINKWSKKYRIHRETREIIDYDEASDTCYFQGARYYKSSQISRLYPSIQSGAIEKEIVKQARIQFKKANPNVFRAVVRSLENWNLLAESEIWLNENAFSDFFPVPISAEENIFIYKWVRWGSAEELMLRIGVEFDAETLVKALRTQNNCKRNYLRDPVSPDIFRLENFVTWSSYTDIIPTFTFSHEDRKGEGVYIDKATWELWWHSNGSFVSSAQFVQAEIRQYVHTRRMRILRLREDLKLMRLPKDSPLFKLSDWSHVRPEWYFDDLTEAKLQWELRLLEKAVRTFWGGYILYSEAVKVRDKKLDEIWSIKSSLLNSGFRLEGNRWYLSSPESEFSLLSMDFEYYLTNINPNWKAQNTITIDGTLYYDYEKFSLLLQEEGYICSLKDGEAFYQFKGKTYLVSSSVSKDSNAIGERLGMWSRRIIAAVKELSQTWHWGIGTYIFNKTERRMELLYEVNALIAYITAFELKKKHRDG